MSVIGGTRAVATTREKKKVGYARQKKKNKKNLNTRQKKCR